MKIHHLTSIPIVLAALSALTLLPSSAAGGRITEEARTTAAYAYNSSVHEAKTDYYLALAIVNNLPTAASRAAAKAEAVAAYREALELADDQLHARRRLAADLGERRYQPAIVPADFLSVAEIVASPNPLLPLTPGKTYHYRADTEEGIETVAFEFTRDTRSILGVTCIVVHDVVRVDGAVVEDTFDWFAQDRAGNVWYFGERSVDYDADGLVSGTHGSWEAGVDGALPGIVMPAQPTVGKVYRQEYAIGTAEDAAKVLALAEAVTVPAGTFPKCLQTADFTPVEPDALEHKYYAPGIGRVLEIKPESGKRVELISISNN